MIAVLEVVIIGKHVKRRFRDVSAGGAGSARCGGVVETGGKLVPSSVLVVGSAGWEVEHEILRDHFYLMVHGVTWRAIIKQH